MLTKSRQPDGRGLTYGGVAIAYRAASLTLREIPFPNPEAFEVLVAAGNIGGFSSKLVVISAYMPPGDPVAREGLVLITLVNLS